MTLFFKMKHIKSIGITVGSRERPHYQRPLETYLQYEEKYRKEREEKQKAKHFEDKEVIYRKKNPIRQERTASIYPSKPFEDKEVVYRKKNPIRQERPASIYPSRYSEKYHANCEKKDRRVTWHISEVTNATPVGTDINQLLKYYEKQSERMKHFLNNDEEYVDQRNTKQHNQERNYTMLQRPVTTCVIKKQNKNVFECQQHTNMRVTCAKQRENKRCATGSENQSSIIKNLHVEDYVIEPNRNIDLRIKNPLRGGVVSKTKSVPNLFLTDKDLADYHSNGHCQKPTYISSLQSVEHGIGDDVQVKLRQPPSVKCSIDKRNSVCVELSCKTIEKSVYFEVV